MEILNVTKVYKNKSLCEQVSRNKFTCATVKRFVLNDGPRAIIDHAEKLGIFTLYSLSSYYVRTLTFQKLTNIFN